jgi:hypothetical protein
MFSRPFQDFDPGPEELAMSPSVRETFVGRVKRCTDAGVLTGDPVDIAHVLLLWHKVWRFRKVAAGWASRRCR